MNPLDGDSDAKERARLSIPDHTLLSVIGQGSYGKVWLARNVMGLYRAIKIIQRQDFKDDAPFDREIRGIRQFEPISRSHPGFINLLHVGENREAGYFYYVMELGDALDDGPDIHPETYRVKTLDQWLKRDGCLAPDQCLKLGLRLSDALAHLHQVGLVHRDVKPPNIIFVQGLPKLADIGLVSPVQEAQTMVGTLGFIPPEGPGSEQADVYGLGKVLYESLTGLDRQDFPEVPSLREGIQQGFFELNEIILKACERDPDNRYHTVRHMHAELTVLENGESIVRLRSLERNWARFKKATRAVAAAALVTLLVGAWAYREFDRAQSERITAAGNLHAGSVQAMDQGRFGRALQQAAQAIALYPDDPRNDENRRRFSSLLGCHPKLTRMQTHGSQINVAAISPDNRSFLVALAAGRTTLYELESGDVIAQMPRHEGSVLSAAFSPDSGSVATCDVFGRICVGDASTGDLLHEFQHDELVTAVAFSAEGHFLASGDAEGFVQIWNLETFTLHTNLSLHTDVVETIAFSPNGALMATAARDDSACVLNPFGTPELKRFQHASWVYHVAFSPDSRRIVTACADDAAYVWALEPEARSMPPLQHTRFVHAAEFSPDGRHIVTAGWDSQVRLWDARTGQPQFPILEHSSPVMSACFDADGRRILTACTDGSLRVWDRAGLRVPTYLNRVTLSPDGSHYLPWKVPQMRVLSLNDGCPLPHPVLSPITNIVDFSLSRSGSHALAIRKGKDPADALPFGLEVWDSHTGALLLSEAIPRDDLDRIAFNPHPATVAWVGEDAIHVRNLSDAVTHSISFPNASNGNAIAFSPNGSQLAATLGPTVFLFDPTHGDSPPTALHHDKPVHRLVYSPDSKQLAVCTANRNNLDGCYAQIWNAQSGAPKGPKLWQADGINDAAWSTDGTRLILVGEEGVIQHWNTDPVRLVIADFFHSDQIADVDVGGNTFVTGGWDTDIRLWDTASGFPISPPLDHPQYVVGVLFAPSDGSVLAIEQGNHSWAWPLPQEPRPAAVLLQFAQILAAKTSAPLPGDFHQEALELTRVWTQLAERHSELVRVEMKEIIAWHRAQAAMVRDGSDHAANYFHVERLLRLLPNDTELRMTRDQLVAQLGVERPSMDSPGDDSHQP